MNTPIEHLLQQPEGKTLEFKRDLSSPRNVLKTLVSFANAAGGRLVIGVDDTQRITGVADPLDEEGRIGNLIADGISPRLVPNVEWGSGVRRIFNEAARQGLSEPVIEEIATGVRLRIPLAQQRCGGHTYTGRPASQVSHPCPQGGASRMSKKALRLGDYLQHMRDAADRRRTGDSAPACQCYRRFHE